MTEAPAPLSLIYLDVDDEITSAAARIRGAAAEDVVLVLPFGSRLATSRINFRLLQREAQARGKQLEIITADGSARSLASTAGLPVHPSVLAFEAVRAGVAEPGQGPAEGGSIGRAGASGPDLNGSSGTGATFPTAVIPGGVAASAVHEPPPVGAVDAEETRSRGLEAPRRGAPKVPLVGPPRPPIRTRVAVTVALAVVAAILAVALLALELLPAATITLHPRSDAIGPVELTVEAREDVTAPDPVAQTIPARRFTFPVEARQTFPATGVHVELVKATGNVTFSNFDTGGANRIDAGSIVSTEDGIKFKTLADVTLPNATIQFPFTIVPSTSTVDVEAVKGGLVGNVGNNTITQVPEGENRILLSVTNVEATTGGARNELPEVSEDDVTAATTALTAALVSALDSQVAARQGVPEGITLFAETRAVGEAQYTVDPATLVGTAAEEFSLGATAVGTAIGVDPAPIDAIAEARLAEHVTQGWSLLPGSATTTVGTPTALGATITFPVTIIATQVHDVDEAALLASVRGLNLAEARSRLDDFGDVDIAVWPEWVTKIPTREDRVTFTIAEPQASVEP